MTGDLRRKMILKHMDKFNEEQRNLPLNSETQEDTLGDLPSFTNRIRTKTQKKVSNNVPIDNERDDFPGWEDYFQYKEFVKLDERNFEFNTYYSLPKNTSSSTVPIFIFHHGAGSSGLSFANLSKIIYERNKGNCGCFSFDARGHGKTRPIDSSKEVKYDRATFVEDFKQLINSFYENHLLALTETTKLSLIFVGHSLGGSICTFTYPELSKNIQKQILGVAMFDIVEEAAILALQKIQHFLTVTPNVFGSYKEALDWHINHELSKNKSSAEIAVPALFHKTKLGKVVRITNLNDFAPYWDTWFVKLSQS